MQRCLFLMADEIARIWAGKKTDTKMKEIKPAQK